MGLRRNVADALAAASGDVVVLADHDDLWRPGKLAAISKEFADPEVSVWFSDADLVDENDHDLGQTLWSAVSFTPDEQESMRNGQGLRRLLHGMTVTGATMAVRRDVVESALPFPDGVGGPNDFYLHDGWLAVLGCLRGRMVPSSSKFVAYRRHAAQLTANAMEQPRDAVSRRAQLALDAARVNLVAARVSDGGGWDPDGGAELRELDTFLSTRTMSAGMSKQAAVLRQYRHGAYGRYARGLRTAVIDIIQGLPFWR